MSKPQPCLRDVPKAGTPAGECVDSRKQLAACLYRDVQLTNYPGVERQPTISPHGKQLADSWNGENHDITDIYVRFIDGGKPLRLTTRADMDGWPAWSPDDRWLAVAASDRRVGSNLYMVENFR